jgi:homoserine dehydrogenase
LGTVGYGIYQELVSRPESFEVVGIGVRNLDRPEQKVPQHLLSTDVWKVVNRDCDILIEALGGIQPAADCIRAALVAGKHVVTANKAALAHHPELHEIARQSGIDLLCSAAVGGAVPVLETLQRIAREHEIQTVEGVLNGTTNFILNELARGIPFDQAVAQAQASGLAEADPSADLDGSDVACKLVLIARAAFGVDLPFASVHRVGISEVDPRHVFDLSKSGSAVRLVGSLLRDVDGITAEVKPVVLEAGQPLANTNGEENCVVVKTANGETHILHGKGAGRWPTTEAVFADLSSLVRGRHCAVQSHEQEHSAKIVVAAAVAAGEEALAL